MFVSLIGYRGTGKSTVARRLADRLHCDYADSDTEIERRAGRTIRDIFATPGEPEFRRLEREIISELVQRKDLVLSTGGGAILNEATRNDLRNAGTVVWLTATLETIAKRILVDNTESQIRPNLTATGGIDEIRTLLAARKPLYRECASIDLATDDVPIETIVERIIEYVHRSNKGDAER
jgi:shikimate kinase